MAIGYHQLPNATRVWQPADLRMAWELRQQYGEESCYISGGTLLRTQWESGLLVMSTNLISLDRISELQGVTWEKQSSHTGVLRIGAWTSLSACRKHPMLMEHVPTLSDACRQIAAPSIRNLGTIGGNIVSGIGDALPLLLAMDAVLIWYDGKGTVHQPIEDWLAQRRRMDASLSDHDNQRILMEVNIPLKNNKDVQDQSIMYFYKVGRREAFVPSLVTVAASCTCKKDGTLHNVRLTAAGGAAIATRLNIAEKLLEGKAPDAALFIRAHEAIWREWDAPGDVFGSSDYRKKVAANLLIAELWKLKRS